MARRRTRRAATGGGSDCQKKCVEEMRACTTQATAEFRALVDACQRITDPHARAQCMSHAASYFAASVQGCQTVYDLCLDACG